MGSEGALVRGVSRREKDQEIGVSLATPDMIRILQEALGIKAKQTPAYRFRLLDDKVLGRTSRQLGVSGRSLISITGHS